MKKVFNLGRQRAVLIYERILSVTAEKPDGRRFIHSFTTRARIWGLENGMILIESPYKLKLWGDFVTSSEDVERLKRRDEPATVVSIDSEDDSVYTIAIDDEDEQ
jgi:hypothetical protein